MLVWEIISALATSTLALVGCLALGQIREVRNSRQTEVMLELGRRWDSDEMIRSRVLADSYDQKLGGLLPAVRRGFAKRDITYYELLREPGFLEDLAIHYFDGSISGDQLYNSMGLLIPERWELWKDAVEFLRGTRDSDMVFEQFHLMQEEMKARRSGPVPKVKSLRFGDRVISYSKSV